MVRPDVVEYLKQNLPSFPVETLRAQLAAEGVSETDISDSLAEALRAPKTATKTAPKPKAAPAASAAALAFLGLGVLVILGVGYFALSKKPEAAKAEGVTVSSTGESGYIGHAGWVVRLPKDYTGMSEFRDRDKRHQVVYFCKKDTDPTNFLNEGLYGQMGIIRLEVMPTEFPNNPTGLANLSRLAAAKYTRAREKYSMKNIQVATLPGLQVTILQPFPRVETFVLGQDHLYFFYAGEENEVWRDIVLSLRDARTEN
jgi:hypothetical protein